MSDLARQQSDFQRAILTGDESILAEIPDGPKEKREYFAELSILLVPQRPFHSQAHRELDH